MMKRFVLLVSALFVFVAASAAQTPTASRAASTTSTTDTAAKKPPVFRPTKDQILQVQKILKEKKFYDGEATGVYNDPTREGIKTFQKGNGLNETGTLNRATLEKFGVTLTVAQKEIPVSSGSYASGPKDTSTDKPTNTSSTSTNASVNAPKRPAPFRANGDQIKAAQKILKAGKMYAGEETGSLDDATRDGLGKYQQANGLKVTNSLNAATLDKMSISLTDAQKANVAAQAAYDAAKPKN